MHSFLSYCIHRTVFGGVGFVKVIQPLSEPVFHGNCQNQINMACRATDVHSVDIRHYISHCSTLQSIYIFWKVPPKLQRIVKILCTWRDILSIQSRRLRSSECVCYISRSGLVYVTGFH